jgi:hypothetical protein
MMWNPAAEENTASVAGLRVKSMIDDISTRVGARQSSQPPSVSPSQ